MTDVSLNLSIDDDRWAKALPNVSALAEKVKTVTFAYVYKNEKTILQTLNQHTFVNVCLSNDGSVQILNRDFRGLDKPTNVLSFANIDFADFAAENSCFEETDLGNIILAYETMAAEAKMQQISLEAHFCHLLIHGFLHILGYDHMTDDEAEIMEDLEIRILAQLNIANPYEENI